jgi:hypothetical protein
MSRKMNQPTKDILTAISLFDEPIDRKLIKQIVPGLNNSSIHGIQHLLRANYIARQFIVNPGPRTGRGQVSVYSYSLTEKGKQFLAGHPIPPQVKIKLKPAPPPLPTEQVISEKPAAENQPTAAELVEQIFSRICSLIKENELLKELNADLLEENKQLRVLAGKQQRKPLVIPEFVLANYVGK